MQVLNRPVGINRVSKPIGLSIARNRFDVATHSPEVRMQGDFTHSLPKKLGIVMLALAPLTSLLSGCDTPKTPAVQNTPAATRPVQTVETPSAIETNKPAKTLAGKVERHWNFGSGSIDSKGNVYNTLGFPQGSIDKNGNAYNVLGFKIGSCSDDGTIYGVFLPVGSISQDGTVSKTFSLFSLGKIDIPKLSLKEKGAAAYLLFHSDFNPD